MRLIYGFILLTVIALATFATMRRWQCLDCSETRLFVQDWPVYIGGVVLVLLAYGVLMAVGIAAKKRD